MAAYPTSSGPTPSIVAIRTPVVSSLRCEQRTALGAAEVPDVKSRAHRTSGSYSVVRGCRRPSPKTSSPAVSSASSNGSPAEMGGSSGSEKRCETRSPPGSSNPSAKGWSSCCWRRSVMTSCTSVCDMSPRQVFPPPCVIQPHQCSSDKSGPAKREDIVRGVVEEHGDMRRPARVEPGPEERGEPLGFN